VYLQVLIITFKIAGWTTIICIVAGYPVAYLLATTTPNTRGMLILWVLLPFWTSFLVRTFAWIVLLGRNGAVNKLLMAAGITDAPLALIYNFTGVMIGMTHALMPLGILTMTSVMQSIPNNLVPAAGNPRRPGRSSLLAHLLPSLTARSRGGQSPGIYHCSRFLHHAGPSWWRSRDDDQPGHHREHPEQCSTGDSPVPSRCCFW
jgi:ABC-type molybdate transport system permease subunit